MIKIFLVVFSAITALSAVSKTSESEITANYITGRIKEFQQSHQINGVTGVVQVDKTIYAEGFGFADLAVYMAN